ncbi:MAG: hypothetical protein ABIH03_02155 [Pseudomonadota bacterium]
MNVSLRGVIVSCQFKPFGDSVRCAVEMDCIDQDEFWQIKLQDGIDKYVFRKSHVPVTARITAETEHVCPDAILVPKHIRVEHGARVIRILLLLPQEAADEVGGMMLSESVGLSLQGEDGHG